MGTSRKWNADTVSVSVHSVLNKILSTEIFINGFYQISVESKIGAHAPKVSDLRKSIDNSNAELIFVHSFEF